MLFLNEFWLGSWAYIKSFFRKKASLILGIDELRWIHSWFVGVIALLLVEIAMAVNRRQAIRSLFLFKWCDFHGLVCYISANYRCCLKNATLPHPLLWLALKLVVLIYTNTSRLILIGLQKVIVTNFFKSSIVLLALICCYRSSKFFGEDVILQIWKRLLNIIYFWRINIKTNMSHILTSWTI